MRIERVSRVPRHRVCVLSVVRDITCDDAVELPQGRDAVLIPRDRGRGGDQAGARGGGAGSGVLSGVCALVKYKWNEVTVC